MGADGGICMKCPHCGDTVPRKRRFCVCCGHDLSEPAEPKPTQQPQVPPSPAPKPVPPAKPLSPEDFFADLRPKRKPAQMNEVTAAQTRALAPIEPNPVHHNTRMGSAPAADGAQLAPNANPFGRHSTMQGAGHADPEQLQAHVQAASHVRMKEASGSDEFNNEPARRKAQVTMSDELRPVEPLPPHRDETGRIDISGFQRGRQNHSISLEIPSLESI